MFFACHFQEEHSSLDNKNYVESIFIVYRIKYQKIKIDLTSPLKLIQYTPVKWDSEGTIKILPTPKHKILEFKLK